MQYFFDVIDRHFNIRKLLTGLHKQLDEKSHQFRSVQKLILVRLKVCRNYLASRLDLSDFLVCIEDVNSYMLNFQARQ